MNEAEADRQTHVHDLPSQAGRLRGHVLLPPLPPLLMLLLLLQHLLQLTHPQQIAGLPVH
jgi:hypothetical protein